MRSVIEVFTAGEWLPAAEFLPLGPYESTFEYRVEYVFLQHPQPVAVSLNRPVGLGRSGVDGEIGAARCPAFLLDLVPEGRGRKLLIHELALADSEAHDLLLAQHGAFNPIGNLRLDTAVKYYENWKKRNREDLRGGFSLKDIINRQEDFLEHIWLHAMYAAGTTGVQGAAPKFLLTQNHDGLWFADAALPDADAAKHWLVKLPRGTHETDFAILRNEAAYLRVAKRCGLRVEGEPMHEAGMLFVPRFDRAVIDGTLHRHAQETLASLAGMIGFGVPVSLFELVESFRRHVTNPVSEIIEFIRRDVLNLALRNTDNHARNTSVQTLADGTVRLTPIYDFAPMFLDREMIARSCKWKTKDRVDCDDLNEIVGNLQCSALEKEEIARGLQGFTKLVAELPEIMRDCDVDKQLIERCMPHIDHQLKRLGSVRAYGQTP